MATAAAFVGALQGEEGLLLAELWAFPAMLRLAAPEEIVADFSQLVPPLWPPFQASGAADRENLDPTEGLSRAIMALAAIERIDWKAFVEATSRVEAILREAPDGLHTQMDFETRDRYRKAVEDLVEGSGRSEPDIARMVVRLARDHAPAPRPGHAGWWFIDEGRDEVERLTGYRARRGDRLRRLALRRPGCFYAAGLAGVTAAALAVPLAIPPEWGADSGVLALLALPLVIPASIVAVTLTNWLVTQVVPPRNLPKMALRGGLPEGMAAAVIVPAILRAPEEVAPLLDRLERHMPTNPDPRLRYALLSDSADAAAEVIAGDDALEVALVEGVRALNRRHAAAPFTLLHRRCVWNAADGLWMGWERKRGKIEAFNEFLHDGYVAAFPLSEGDVEGLRGAQFVVMLDADTVAPPGAVHRLLGALAHPLNRVEFDGADDRIVAGYTFVQPSIELSTEAGAVSPFTRHYASDTAIDI